MDYSPPDSSAHGIFQARTLECAAISFSRDLPDPGIEPWSPALQADSLLSEPPGKLSLEGGPERKEKTAEQRDPNPAWGVGGDFSDVGHPA